MEINLKEHGKPLKSNNLNIISRFMTKKSFLFIFFIILCFGSAYAQTFVGEMLYQGKYQYIKIICQDSSCEFSMPFEEGNKKYKIKENIFKENEWSINRDLEDWKFKTIIDDSSIKGEIYSLNGNQIIELLRQKKRIPVEKLNQYVGTFQDAKNNNVIVYSSFNSLQIISPYSEENMSLKPIGNNMFWSFTGEKTLFSNFQNNEFKSLKITDRFGNTKQLKKNTPINVKELFIPIDNDTIYAKLYSPTNIKGKTSACLILPGGGGIGIENYEFEARLFAANGITSLVFDKAGNGKSRGASNFRTQTFEEVNDLYIKIFKFLQNLPETDPKKVGVHGPSEGGRLALMMAIDLKDNIAFVNAVAAPLMSLKEGQFYAMDQLHRNLGIDEKDNLIIQQIWSEYYDGIIEGKINSEIINKSNTYRALNSKLFLPPNSNQIPSSPSKEDLLNDRVVKEASQIMCPIFLQYGENDQRVNLSKSLQNFYPKLSKGTKISAKIYKRGNHSLLTPEFKICTGYINDKIKWLKSIDILE